jgi:hypothetical protein
VFLLPQFRPDILLQISQVLGDHSMLEIMGCEDSPLVAFLMIFSLIFKNEE